MRMYLYTFEVLKMVVLNPLETLILLGETRFTAGERGMERVKGIEPSFRYPHQKPRYLGVFCLPPISSLVFTILTFILTFEF